MVFNYEYIVIRGTIGNCVEGLSKLLISASVRFFGSSGMLGAVLPQVTWSESVSDGQILIRRSISSGTFGPFEREMFFRTSD